MKAKISVMKAVPACFAKDRFKPKDIMNWSVYPGYRRPCMDFRRDLGESRDIIPGMFYAEIREMTVSLN